MLIAILEKTRLGQMNNVKTIYFVLDDYRQGLTRWMNIYRQDYERGLDDYRQEAWPDEWLSSRLRGDS